MSKSYLPARGWFSTEYGAQFWPLKCKETFVDGLWENILSLFWISLQKKSIISWGTVKYGRETVNTDIVMCRCASLTSASICFWPKDKANTQRKRTEHGIKGKLMGANNLRECWSLPISRLTSVYVNASVRMCLAPRNKICEHLLNQEQ